MTDMDLYKETIEELREYGKTLDDVVAICGEEFQIEKDDFIKLSKTKYDSGFGAQEVAKDLLVIGKDFWLERHEYDGSEWWEFKELPKYVDLPFKKITALTVGQAAKNGVYCSCGWESLADLNCLTDEDGGEPDA